MDGAALVGTDTGTNRIAGQGPVLSKARHYVPQALSQGTVHLVGAGKAGFTGCFPCPGASRLSGRDRWRRSWNIFRF